MSETSVFPSSFIRSHAADRSVLAQGFSLPNHRRIVHATHAQFRRAAKSFAYPNGLVESLKVNVHL